MARKYIGILIGIHFLIMIFILLFLMVTGQDYQSYVLVDDGYYEHAKQFVEGESLLHKYTGPVMPLILSVLHIFPEKYHTPFRLLISVLFSLGVIIILHNLTKGHLSQRQFFYGGLLFILNPIYIHWTFKSSPEIYLALLLGLFISALLMHYKTQRIRYLLVAALIFLISIFLKPSFLFIPLFVLVALLIIRSKKLIFAALTLMAISTIGYFVFNEITKIEVETQIKATEKRRYGAKQLIHDSFWTDYVLHTRQYHKGTVKVYNPPENPDAPYYGIGGSIEDVMNMTAGVWIDEYLDRNPDSGYLEMNLHFIFSETKLFLQKLIFSPVFFFSMSAYPIQTFVNLALSLVSIFLAVWGLIIIRKTRSHTDGIVIILGTLLGYMSLFFLLHAMNRYSLPILPYLYVWGGITIEKLIDKTFKRCPPK